MTYLLIFLAGILFIQFIMPLLDGLLSVVLLALEAKKAALSEKVNESNIKMKQAATSAEEAMYPKPRQIGFTAPAEEYETEEDEDYDNEDL